MKNSTRARKRDKKTLSKNLAFGVDFDKVGSAKSRKNKNSLPKNWENDIGKKVKESWSEGDGDRKRQKCDHDIEIFTSILQKRPRKKIASEILKSFSDFQKVSQLWKRNKVDEEVTVIIKTTKILKITIDKKSPRNQKVNYQSSKAPPICLKSP